MSKSMWIDAVEQKPVKAQASNYESEWVLVWLKDHDTPNWAFYSFNENGWRVDGIGFVQAYHIEYFAYISNPYK